MIASDLSSSFNAAIATADFGARLVIIGIFVEVVDLVVKCGENERFCKWFGDPNRFEEMNLNRLKKFSKIFHPWTLAIEITSFALVVIGLSIEVSGSNEAYRISALQNSALNKEAGDARKYAGNAILLAADSNARASKFDLARAEIEKQSEELRSNNLVLQTNVLALQLKLQWRTINPAQEKNLIKLLKPIVDAFPQKDRKVLITLEPPADKEQWSFGNRIFDVLKKCDFDVESKPSLSIPNLSGLPLAKEFEENLVLIGRRGGEVTPPPFSSLAQGLGREGIIGEAKVYRFPGEPPPWLFSDNQLWIIVTCKNEK